jgi:hypothetical protein
MSFPSDYANYVLGCGANHEASHCAAFSIFLTLFLLSYPIISLNTLFEKKKNFGLYNFINAEFRSLFLTRVPESANDIFSPAQQ